VNWRSGELVKVQQMEFFISNTITKRQSVILPFFCFQQKKGTKKIHRCMKFTKNQRHSLNFGNSSLRSSDSPKFLTLIPRFSIHKFHKAGRED
jgi:hypothetical protein